jgi:hydrogenase maturation protease
VIAPRPTVRVLVCGNADRGDDGAALCAAAHVLPRLEPEVRQQLEVRLCRQLDPTDLVDVARDQACIVIDTVVGIEPGAVIELPIAELATWASISPRSSHALPIDQVLGIAQAVRGELPHGTFVGIGGKWFGFGEVRSRALRDGMDRFEATIAAAIEALTQPIRA